MVKHKIRRKAGARGARGRRGWRGDDERRARGGRDGGGRGRGRRDGVAHELASTESEETGEIFRECVRRCVALARASERDDDRLTTSSPHRDLARSTETKMKKTSNARGKGTMADMRAPSMSLAEVGRWRRRTRDDGEEK